jgi:hypothetical protein
MKAIQEQKRKEVILTIDGEMLMDIMMSARKPERPEWLPVGLYAEITHLNPEPEAFTHLKEFVESFINAAPHYEEEVAEFVKAFDDWYCCKPLEGEQMREAEIQNQIIEYLQLRGGKVYRMNAGRARNNVRMSEAGTPDLLAIFPEGKTIWVEVKTPKGKLSEEQLRVHCQLTSYGQRVIVARSVEDVEQELSA